MIITVIRLHFNASIKVSILEHSFVSYLCPKTLNKKQKSVLASCSFVFSVSLLVFFLRQAVFIIKLFPVSSGRVLSI